MALVAGTRAANMEEHARRKCQNVLAVLVPKHASEIRVALVVFILGQ
jgi:hypothetical protein